jgi:hypothetical protein
MQIRIGIENDIEGRTMAWAFDQPGCFAYGRDEAESLINLPKALLDYEYWIKNHTHDPWVNFGDLDMRVVEKYDTFRLGADYKPAPPGEGYEINAWFIDDWRPLSAVEIEHGLMLFRWQRDELLAGLSTLEPVMLEKDFHNQRWNILGIAKHIANAELWYLQRMDLADITRQDLFPDYTARLAQTAAIIEQSFPQFANTVNVIGIEGEIWSFRKILRRTLWHQRDHIDHIKQLAFGIT